MVIRSFLEWIKETIFYFSWFLLLVLSLNIFFVFVYKTFLNQFRWNWSWWLKKRIVCELSCFISNIRNDTYFRFQFLSGRVRVSLTNSGKTWWWCWGVLPEINHNFLRFEFRCFWSWKHLASSWRCWGVIEHLILSIAFGSLSYPLFKCWCSLSRWYHQICVPSNALNTHSWVWKRTIKTSVSKSSCILFQKVFNSHSSLLTFRSLRNRLQQLFCFQKCFSSFLLS